MQKRILFLGGTYFQIPPLRYSKEQGHYVITCDYLPDNPGHAYADEYHNVNATDCEAVLQLAIELNVDAVIAYASDPCAPTAAYVAEKLGLPGNPYESVRILQRKDLFRTFLKKNGYNVPESEGFTDIHPAEVFANRLLKKKAIIVKPSDSSGSKGVTKVSSSEEFRDAFETAMQFSRLGRIVVEEYIKKSTYEMDGDAFVYEGQLAFSCFGNQHNDLHGNPYVPVGISFPYVQEERLQKEVRATIQSILERLNMRVGALNIEYLTNESGDVYILEIGPRNGGNLIPEVIKYSTGVDLIKYTVDAALGMDCSNLKQRTPVGFFSSYIMHAVKAGIIDRFEYSDEIKQCIVEETRWCREGDEAKAFNGSNCTLGTQILEFDSQDQMLRIMNNMHEHQRIVVC